MQSWGLVKEYQVVKLSDTVIRRASLKTAKWKEMRAARAGGGFGGIQRGGELALVSLVNDLTC